MSLRMVLEPYFLKRRDMEKMYFLSDMVSKFQGLKSNRVKRLGTAVEFYSHSIVAGGLELMS